MPYFELSKKPNHKVDINGPLILDQTVEGLVNGRSMTVQVIHPQHVTLNGIERRFSSEGAVLFDERDKEGQPLRGVGFFSIAQSRDYAVLKNILPSWRMHLLALEAFEQMINQVRDLPRRLDFTKKAIEEQGIRYQDWEMQMILARNRRLDPRYFLQNPQSQ